ncbi:hypothetical protein CPB86DRAFT_789845 [Serendipita vermifera]|nr:hypothetical protein CPB86DRAFT_789845 [Serendipita vermifera]
MNRANIFVGQEHLRRNGRFMQLSLLQISQSTPSGHQDILRSFGFLGSSAGVWAPTWTLKSWIQKNEYRRMYEYYGLADETPWGNLFPPGQGSNHKSTPTCFYHFSSQLHL